MASMLQQVNIRTNITFVAAIIMIGICDLFYMSIAYYLCAYKDWSLWTIFWLFLIGTCTTKGIYKVLGIKEEDNERY